jgi:hypothetical protein
VLVDQLMMDQEKLFQLFHDQFERRLSEEKRQYNNKVSNKEQNKLLKIQN